jgi:hypothetical protein
MNEKLETLYHDLFIHAALKGYSKFLHLNEEDGVLIDCTLLQKWLREEHGIYVYIAPNFNLLNSYKGITKSKEGFEQIDTFAGKNVSYEIAILMSLNQALTLIKI